MHIILEEEEFSKIVDALATLVILRLKHWLESLDIGLSYPTSIAMS